MNSSRYVAALVSKSMSCQRVIRPAMHALSDVEMVRTVTVAPSEVARVITNNAPIPEWL